MHLDENWGIEITRIQRFFDAEADVFKEIDGYRYAHCQITLTAIAPQPNALIPIPRTRLEIEGPDEEVRVIHRRFFLRFLSAGG